MIKVTLENTLTGETKIVNGPASFTAPWKIQSIEKVANEKKYPTRLVVWAQKRGMPVAQFLDAARFLLQKDCPFCQTGTKVLKEIDRLGEDRAEKILDEILAAKDAGNTARLAEIRKELWPLEQPESLPQS